MSLPLPPLPTVMVAENLSTEIEMFRQNETDPNLWRILDREYLLLLGTSVIIRHLVRLAVHVGMHPAYILVSCAIQPKHYIS